ncbi:MAG: GatB/YqeY domain-containing protein [Chloroflexi bacterium]|nr:GatB/YqeY domain-containing protein [Chloroflexota bacterium]
MSLVQRLRDDLNQSLKKRDKERVSALRLVLADMSNAEIAKGAPLDEAGLLGVISKRVKLYRESIDAFRKGNRQDLVAKEEKELAAVLEYLPQPMSAEEITAAARQAIKEVGATGPGDKGKVMGKLMPQVKGKADGAEVSAIVSQLLSSL